MDRVRARRLGYLRIGTEMGEDPAVKAVAQTEMEKGDRGGGGLFFFMFSIFLPFLHAPRLSFTITVTSQHHHHCAPTTSQHHHHCAPTRLAHTLHLHRLARKLAILSQVPSLHHHCTVIVPSRAPSNSIHFRCCRCAVHHHHCTITAPPLHRHCTVTMFLQGYASALS